MMMLTSHGRHERRFLIAVAIALQEGWFEADADNIPRRLNNPGNLRWADPRFAQHGSEKGYVRFLTIGSGWAALENDITAKARKVDVDTMRGWTFEKMINVYCPIGDGANDPDRYLLAVCGRLETHPRDIVIEWTGALPKVLGQYPDAEVPVPGPPRPSVPLRCR